MNVSLASLFAEPPFIHHADPLEILSLELANIGFWAGKCPGQMPSWSSIGQLQLGDLLPCHLKECADEFTFSVYGVFIWVNCFKVGQNDHHNLS